MLWVVGFAAEEEDGGGGGGCDGVTDGRTPVSECRSVGMVSFEWLEGVRMSRRRGLVILFGVCCFVVVFEVGVDCDGSWTAAGAVAACAEGGIFLFLRM